MSNRTKFFVILAASMLVAQIAQADTKTYTGMGDVVRSELTLNLGNGQTVFSARSEGMATISTEPPALLEVKCMGLGLISGENDAVTDAYCTFRMGDDDAFDIKAISNAKGGTADVIGGSGKWKDAIGTVTFERLSTTENGGSFSYKITITTP